MKGLVYLGNKKIELKEIENPNITDSKDAIVKVVLSSICTSDFHIINGQVPRAKENIVLGHEFVGEVIEIGSGVKKLNKGDTAIFSSSIVPGNEKDVFAVFNELSKIGVHIIYRANNKLIHASGHGSAVELAELYNMVKPKALIPMHGEAIHLLENERVGRDCGIKNTLVIENGQVVSISNTNKVIEHIGNVPVGEIAVDGNLQVKTSNSVFKDRKKLNYNGVAFISAVIDRKAKLQDDTEITFIGVSDNPQIQVLKSEIKKSIRDSIDRLSKKEKSDKTRLKDVIEACARTLIRDYTDKKVQCTVHLTIK